MAAPNKEAFVKLWPRCFIIFMGIVEIIAAIFLGLAELGNVAANFWTTNVFAGGWCAIIVLAHAIAVFVTACCAPGPAAALRAAVVSVISIIATIACIVFNALFIAQPSTCILTPSCSSNAASTSNFSYYFQQSFISRFNSLAGFSTYTLSQAKLLFQATQLGLASLCLILAVIYLIIYYLIRSKTSNQVEPNDAGNRMGGPANYDLDRNGQRKGNRPPPRQSNPGANGWSNRKRY